MSEEKGRGKSKLMNPAVLGGGVVVIWVLFGWIMPLAYDSDDRGTLGDQFGSVNSLFAGLAFAGLIYTVWMQREELALQREELKLTRKEMEASTAAQGASAAALNKQVLLSAMSAQINGYAALLQQKTSEISTKQREHSSIREQTGYYSGNVFNTQKERREELWLCQKIDGLNKEMERLVKEASMDEGSSEGLSKDDPVDDQGRVSGDHA